MQHVHVVASEKKMKQVIQKEQVDVEMDPPIFLVWSHDDVIQGKYGRKCVFTRIEVPRFQKSNKKICDQNLDHS